MNYKPLFNHIIAVIMALGTFTVANAYAPTYYSSNSKLSTGHWVKIKVSEIGMHEISHDKLRELGFDNPANVCVYGYGGTRLTQNTFNETFPDDLPAQPVYYGDDKIIFYGEPDLRVNLGSNAYKIDVARNVYSDAGYYFLSDCQPGASAMGTSIKYNLSNILKREYHNCILYTEKEIDNPGMAGAFFFDRSIIDNPVTYSFKPTKPYKPSDEAAGLRYGYAAKVPSYTALNVEFNHPDSLITKTDHRTVIPSSLSSQYYYTSSGDINFNLYESSDSTYNFTFNVPSSVKASYAAIDYVYLAYRRKNDFENESQMRMSFLQVNQNTNFVIANANAGIQVWNVTNPMNIYPHATSFSESTKNIIGSFEKTYSYSSTGNACLVAFDPNKKQLEAEIIGTVENQNLHNFQAPHMVIITNDLCQPYADQVAQLHREHQGMDVIVVNQKQIFNEFSSGTPSAMGYRRFLKMFYDRNPSKFKYLLLFGDGSWDNRGLIYPNPDRLLTYQAEVVDDARSAAKAFCGDSYFGMLNDNYDPETFYNNEAHIAVGRIPASSQANAQAAVNKIAKYFQNPPTNAVFNRAILLADEGDSFGHIIQQEENIDSIMSISPATTCLRAYSTLYPSTTFNAAEARDQIIQALSQGQGFFSFAGHGGATTFSTKNLWNTSSISGVSYNHYPIAMFATCDAFAFDRGDGGMAEQSLYAENGGFIAVVAASRTVYMQFNQYINRAFTCQLFGADDEDLIGDVFRKARNRAATQIVDRTLGVNTMCYNLAGDPALPIYKPSFAVKTNSINGEEASTDTYHQLKPLAKNSIIGEITDNNGNLQDSFNGKITLSIYDGPTGYSVVTNKNGTVVTCLDTTYTEPTHSYRSSDSLNLILDENLLTELSVPVVNGKFEATIVTPMPQKANSINRTTYFAISDDGKHRANGYFNFISVANYDESADINDNTAPVVKECYINDPSFNNGDIVESDFVLYAIIEADESGINTSTGAIGMGTTLTLDGSKTFPSVRTALVSNADGSNSLSFHLNDIEDGQHFLTLSVADNAGNRSNHNIYFTVINKSAQVTLYVAETPARKEATFDIEHNFNDEPTGRLIIENSNGETIFSKGNCQFPYTWNLKDQEGNTVTDGNYKAYVILNGGKQYGNSAKIPVIVVK